MPARRRLVPIFVLLAVTAGLSASQATREAARIYPRDASQKTVPLADCAVGTTTVLKAGGLSRSQRHNGNSGEAHFALHDKQSHALLWKDEYVGEGTCFGFNADRSVYLVGSRKPHGIGVRLTDLIYVDAAARSSRLSAFNRQKLEAFAAVPGPGLRRLALIGMHGNDVSLFVLDVGRDVLKNLGRAPLPPPLTAEERAYAQQHPGTLDGSWDWMASFRDSYTKLEPEILRFVSDDVLEASFGADTADARAKDRQNVTFRLDAASPLRD